MVDSAEETSGGYSKLQGVVPHLKALTFIANPEARNGNFGVSLGSGSGEIMEPMGLRKRHCDVLSTTTNN